MSEERFWTTDESISTAKFAVHDGAMTMRQTGCIFRLDHAQPKVEMSQDALLKGSKNKT